MMRGLGSEPGTRGVCFHLFGPPAGAALDLIKLTLPGVAGVRKLPRISVSPFSCSSLT